MSYVFKMPNTSGTEQRDRLIQMIISQYKLLDTNTAVTNLSGSKDSIVDELSGMRARLRQRPFVMKLIGERNHS